VLRDWVSHGGHLVVSLSPKNWQRVGEVLKDLLPARPTGPQTLVDLAAVEGFADKVSRQIKQPMTVVKLEPMDSKTVTLAATAATPLVVRRAFGLGRVTLTGVDVSVEPFSTWSDRKSYWDKLIDIRGRSSDAEAAGAVAGGALIQSANPDLAARLLQALGTFPGVSLIPFGWVAGLIFAYLLLIGPIDYFLLKRVFKRMEWTWITFPLIVLATTILAFQLARAMKGSDLRVNRIDLMDVEQATGIYRGSTWMTVLSPGNHDFGFELHGYTPNLNPLKLSEGNSSFSWFAPPEAGLSRIGRIALGNHKVEVKKSGLSGERIPIWSTKSFSGRWSGLSGPVSLVESTLRTEPGDRAGGSIRNRSGKTLQRAQLYYGKNVYDLGTIRPDNIARVSSTRSEAIPRALGRFVQEALRAGKPVEDAAAGRTGIRGAEVSPPAAGLLRAALFHDAMGSRADVYPSFPLRPLDLTNQVVDLRRPVLVAEIEDEACSVIIQGGPDGSLVPKVQQMTVVRIILDMDAPTPVNPNSTPASAPASPSSSSADATSGTVP